MKKISLIIASLIFSVGMVVADGPEATHQVNINVPTVALIDVEGPGGNNSISFTLTAPEEAGLGFVAPSANNTLWLNLTSIVSSTQTRKVSVNLQSSLQSDALGLTVSAAEHSGVGSGTFGEPVGEIEIGATPKDLITGIGSAWTGNGINNGYQLTYNLVIDEDKYDVLFKQNETATIVYTISGDN